MTSRVINCEHDARQLVALIQGKKPPYSVTITDGRKRSIAQNKMQRLWMNEIADQLGEYTAEYYRGWCKAWFGIPILCAASQEYCDDYNEHIRDLPYETKIRLMQEPWDFKVTREMTVPQKSEYLQAVYDHFTGLGVMLTEPGEY